MNPSRPREDIAKDGNSESTMITRKEFHISARKRAVRGDRANDDTTKTRYD